MWSVRCGTRARCQDDPKGTDLSRWNPDDLAAVAHALTTRPRKRRGRRTPAGALDDRLHVLHAGGDATTR